MLTTPSLAANLELIEDDDPGLAHDHTYDREFAQWLDVGAGSERDAFLRANRRRIAGKYAIAKKSRIITSELKMLLITPCSDLSGLILRTIS